MKKSKHGKAVLFVCMGNICRSPTAEGIFQKMVNDAGREAEFDIDSAGTIDYHSGQRSDGRMRAVALEYGYQLDSIARQIKASDFDRFDLVVVMDEANFRDVERISPGYGAEIVRMCDYCERFEETEVPDPYYGGQSGFHKVIEMLEDACSNLLKRT